MKIMFVVIQLVAFLFANTAFGQLLRLPTLVHHYQEHVQWDNSTLVEFLKTHYAKQIDHPDDQHHDHENLPFKVVDANHTSVANAPANSPLFILSNKVDFAISTSENTSYKNPHFDAVHLMNIWQPPKS